MCKRWNTLKNTIEAAVTDLRALQVEAELAISLGYPVDVLEWIVRFEPEKLESADLFAGWIDDTLSDLVDIANHADNAGNIEVRDRIMGAVRSVRLALAGWRD